MQPGNKPQNKFLFNAKVQPVTDEQSELQFNQINHNVINAIGPVNISFGHQVINIKPKEHVLSRQTTPESKAEQYNQKKPFYCCWPFSLCCWKKPNHHKEQTRIEDELTPHSAIIPRNQPNY